MKNFALRTCQATEAQEQTALFRWAAIEVRRDPRLELLNSSQNGLRASSIAAAALAKKAGMKKGVPDISLPVAVAPYHGLFIELKAGHNKPTAEQAQWLDRLQAQGYLAVAAWGADEAIEIVNVLTATTFLSMLASSKKEFIR